MKGSCYTFTLLISYMVFNPFKIAVQFFKTASNFPILMAQMIFSQIQQVPGPDSRKVGKSLEVLGYYPPASKMPFDWCFAGWAHSGPHLNSYRVTNKKHI